MYSILVNKYDINIKKSTYNINTVSHNDKKGSHHGQEGNKGPFQGLLVLHRDVSDVGCRKKKVKLLKTPLIQFR